MSTSKRSASSIRSPRSTRSTNACAGNGCWRRTGPAGKPKRCARSSSCGATWRRSSGWNRARSSSSSNAGCSITTRRCARAPTSRAGTGLDHEVAARAGGRAGAASDQVTEYTDALRSIRASSHLKLGLATVAVLITDLVGSASLRTSLGDHRADEIERWHEGILTKAVADYQGTIVKRLGDGAMAVFTTATDAVAAAAAIQTRLRARAGPRRPRCRCASASARAKSSSRRTMCAGCRRQKPRGCARRAKGGQILTTQLVQHLAAARSAASFLPFGVLNSKGLPGPTPLYDVPWPVGGGETVPVPDPLTTDRQFSFVGRQAELGALATTWTEACDTSGFGTDS